MASRADDVTAQPVDIGELRRLWDGGQRGPAIRTALGFLDRFIEDGRDLDWLAGALMSSGLPAEAFAVQRAATRRRAAAPAWEALVRSVLDSGDPWWARELLAEAGTESRALQALRIETELAVGDAAPSIAAWVRAYRDEPALEAAARWWVRCNRVDETVRLVDESGGLTLWRARLALWRNRPDVARSLLATLPRDPAARCLEAVACVLDGDLGEAETRLRDLLDTDARPEAWTWLATVLRKQGRYADALHAADTAIDTSHGFNLVARLERDLAVDYDRLGPGGGRLGTFGRRLWQYVRGGGRAPRRLHGLHRIEDLETARVLYPLGLKPRDSIAVLETALERFAGNHTPHLTTTDRGTLTSYPLPDDPRQLGNAVQRVLWTRGAEAARRLYEEIAPHVDDHPLYRMYHGELELWMGAYEKAERIFRNVLDRNPRVRWAWIGLGASVMLQGDMKQAQKLWKRGVARRIGAPGPTLYVYRGECYRRQGELRLARNDLETALQQKPHRLSARINLALLDQDPDALGRAEKDCVALAPQLMAELRGSPAERLEQVLVAMRGNRSSSEWMVSYHLWGHVWRRGV